MAAKSPYGISTRRVSKRNGPKACNPPVTGISWLPKCNSIRSRPGWVEPEVYFRIVHAAPEGHSGVPVGPTYREQTVKIALGPKGTFENGNIGTLTRRVPADRVVNAIPPLGGSPEPPEEPLPPLTPVFTRSPDGRGDVALVSPLL
ncbi:MAG: hypothetical protein Q8O18_02250 [Deltaproteobacteria bacterium]|nr:hypothetical protein [Deltaproteobacteria bacterium]